MICKEDLLKHIKAAIDLEKKGIEKYSEFAAKTSSHHARLLFENLVKQEEKHVIFFEGLLKNVEDDVKLEREEVCERLEKIDAETIFKTDKNVDEVTDNYISALVYSIEIEEKAYDYYTEISEMETNESIKSIFKLIAGYEKEHYNILKEELEYAKNAPST